MITKRSGLIALAFLAGAGLPAAAVAQNAPANPAASTASIGHGTPRPYLVMRETSARESGGEDFDTVGTTASKYVPVYPDEPVSPAETSGVRRIVEIKG
ncbi:hypothetical protein ABLE91_07630 [Aquabacter sp. CN5-332]|uniref:hypothetical protein n=1 Tax=Aquabacter sp. CN5-332 TaxID=3156608 RepID=UPI0032B3A011